MHHYIMPPFLLPSAWLLVVWVVGRAEEGKLRASALHLWAALDAYSSKLPIMTFR